MIQEKNKIPIIYHVISHSFNKSIKYDPFMDSKITQLPLRFLMSLANSYLQDRNKKTGLDSNEHLEDIILSALPQ